MKSVLRLLIAFILFMPYPLLAQSETDKLYFIQVWTVGPYPNEVDDSENPGRIEVSSNGKFVACVQGFVTKNWNSFDLAPVSIGFMYKGDKSKLKFEAYGELKLHTTIQTKITEVQ